jgi:acetyl-CoA carboxylase biotin carboxyl carrier protein
MTDDPGLPFEAEAAIEPVGVPIEPDLVIAADATSAAPDTEAPPPTTNDVGNASLLALIDRLGGLLERSDLSELEVEAGATSLVLRKPEAIAALAATAPGATAPAPTTGVGPTGPGGGDRAALDDRPAAPTRPSIRAPLTGIWYASPTPGSAPFVEVGREVAVGQVVGLIEAMKLFNEIKSDLAGRVVRVIPESGTLVKAKQPLIEVEPL